MYRFVRICVVFDFLKTFARFTAEFIDARSIQRWPLPARMHEAPWIECVRHLFKLDRDIKLLTVSTFTSLRSKYTHKMANEARRTCNVHLFTFICSRSRKLAAASEEFSSVNIISKGKKLIFHYRHRRASTENLQCQRKFIIFQSKWHEILFNRRNTFQCMD